MASRRASATVAIRDAARSCTSRRYWSQRETTIGANLMPPDLSGLPRLVRASGNAARHHSFVRCSHKALTCDKGEVFSWRPRVNETLTAVCPQLLVGQLVPDLGVGRNEDRPQ